MIDRRILHYLKKIGIRITLFPILIVKYDCIVYIDVFTRQHMHSIHTLTRVHAHSFTFLTCRMQNPLDRQSGNQAITCHRLSHPPAVFVESYEYIGQTCHRIVLVYYAHVCQPLLCCLCVLFQHVLTVIFSSVLVRAYFCLYYICVFVPVFCSQPS